MMNIDSKKYNVRTYHGLDGLVSVLSKEQGLSWTLQAGELPSLHVLAQMDEAGFDEAVRSASSCYTYS